MALAWSLAQLTDNALPFIRTTTSGFPAPFKAPSIASSSAGRLRLVRSPPLKPGTSTFISSPSSLGVMPTTATTTSACRAAEQLRSSDRR